jgi:hypothetical protein
LTSINSAAPRLVLLRHRARNAGIRGRRVQRLLLLRAQTIGGPDMTEDIIVLAGLAVVFCWTYIYLPLFHYV